ncbi:MAG: ParB/RepB/Spo0J family partition protein [Ilumatobacteraceae bacterium]
MARHSGLGKGLSALIPSDISSQTGAAIPATSGLRDIEISAIDPNPHQPRVHFDEDTLSELSASIRAIGVLQPILVRPATDGRYELIAGERRWRAATRAGLTVIPAIIRITDDVSSVEQALVENLHRQDLTPLEEAAAYQQLLDDFNMTHENIAKKVGKSRSAITNSVRLLALPAAIQQLLANGRLSAGHAKALLGTPDRAFQEQLARQAADDNWTVRAIEDAVREHQQPAVSTTGTGQKTVPFVSASTVRDRPTLRAPGLLELEHLLAEHLGTTVNVAMSGKNGKVVIQFADLDDLERMYRLMTEGPSSE